MKGFLENKGFESDVFLRGTADKYLLPFSPFLILVGYKSQVLEKRCYGFMAVCIFVMLCLFVVI